MSLSMYQASAPVFLKTLGNLSAILDKAQAFAAQKKIDETVLLDYRLAPDMFPLSRQVQTAADNAKRGVGRLAGVEIPPYEDNEKSFAELKARIEKTMAFVRSIQPEHVDGTEDKTLNYTVGGEPRSMQGQAYLLHNALPNFFFHVTAAYAILRHCGVDIGKNDYLGKLYP